MGDLKLFQLEQGKAVELTGTAMTLEKSLQTLIEHNMETLFGVRCLASEYSTGKKHGGRMDSLGIDENRNPVIFEYKRAGAAYGPQGRGVRPWLAPTSTQGGLNRRFAPHGSTRVRLPLDVRSGHRRASVHPDSRPRPRLGRLSRRL